QGAERCTPLEPFPFGVAALKEHKGHQGHEENRSLSNFVSFVPLVLSRPADWQPHPKRKRSRDAAVFRGGPRLRLARLACWRPHGEPMRVLRVFFPAAVLTSIVVLGPISHLLRAQTRQRTVAARSFADLRT